MSSDRDKSEFAVIYGLYDPRTGELRYIGKAKASGVRKRWKEHCRRSQQQRNTRRCNWLASLLDDGYKPDLRFLAVSWDGRWQDLERQFIAIHRQAGHNLTNTADGGDQPPPLMSEQSEGYFSHWHDMMRWLGLMRAHAKQAGRSSEEPIWEASLATARRIKKNIEQRYSPEDAKTLTEYVAMKQMESKKCRS